MRGTRMDENEKVSKEAIQKIKEFIESVQFGSVNIIIQDGRIIQIEKNEKIRLK
ncbi:MAG: YezD family protein [Agathobacter sp.]